jgi:hypothetical protein
MHGTKKEREAKKIVDISKHTAKAEEEEHTNLVTVVATGQLGERGLDDTTTKTQHQMQRALLLNVVVAQGAAILELLASEDETLLIGRDAFLVLDLLLDSLDGVRALHFQSDGLAREGLHENLHDESTPEGR